MRRKLTTELSGEKMKASLKWAAMAAVVVGMSTQSVLASEAECPYCSLGVLQNTAKQDNEVSLKSGAKTCRVSLRLLRAQRGFQRI
jgi:hypothetical protein